MWAIKKLRIITIPRYVFLGTLLIVAGCATTSSQTQSSILNESEIQQIKGQAETGDVAAQYRLANIYRYQYKDIDGAIHWYKKAAMQKNIEAHMHLATLYRYNKKDTESALEWYRKAFELGDIRGLRNIGLIYRHGEGVDRDLEEAEKWYSIGAERGDSTSKAILKSIQQERDPEWQQEQQRIAEQINLEQQRIKRLPEERKRSALDRYKDIGIIWESTNTELKLGDSTADNTGAEPRGYLYGAIMVVNFPIGLLTAIGGEGSVTALQTLEDSNAKKSLQKVFSDPSIQEKFLDALLTNAKQSLDNKVEIVSTPASDRLYSSNLGVETILKLEKMAINIVPSSGHRYRLDTKIECSLIGNLDHTVLHKRSIKARGKNFSITAPIPDRGTKREINEEAQIQSIREALEGVYNTLSEKIIQYVLNSP